MKGLILIFPMTLQHLRWIVFTNKESTDTLSIFTTLLTAVNDAPAPMARYAVSISRAHSQAALMASLKSAAWPVKVHLSAAENLLFGLLFTFSVYRHVSYSLTGCFHEGQHRTNGETWNDASDLCARCRCHEGSVRCTRRPCPPSNCKHPIQGQCCMSCDGWLPVKPPNTTFILFLKGYRVLFWFFLSPYSVSNMKVKENIDTLIYCDI